MLLLEHADSGSITQTDSVDTERAAELKQADTDTLTCIQQDRAAALRKNILDSTQTLTWYVLTDDPDDYRRVLKEIQNLINFAPSEKALRRGIKQLLSYDPWIAPTQIDVDMRQCHESFEQLIEIDWKATYKKGIEAVLQKL